MRRWKESEGFWIEAFSVLFFIAVLGAIGFVVARYGLEIGRLRREGCEYTGRAHSTIGSDLDGRIQTESVYEYACRNGRKRWSRVSPADAESGDP